LKELRRADTVAYFRTEVNNLLARFALPTWSSRHGAVALYSQTSLVYTALLWGALRHAQHGWSFAGQELV